MSLAGGGAGNQWHISNTGFFGHVEVSSRYSASDWLVLIALVELVEGR